MADPGQILMVNGLALAGESGGIGYRGSLTHLSENPFWEPDLNTGALDAQEYVTGAYVGRILHARFQPGLASEAGRVMAAISPLNGPWTIRAHLLFGVSDLVTVEARVVTTGVRERRGTIEADLQQLDAVWRVVTLPSAVGIGTHNATSWSGGTAYTAAGSAPISPVVTIDPAGPSSGSAPNRYSFTVQNTHAYPLVKMPWLVDLGNTSGWTGSTANNTYLFCDGIEVPREAIAIGETRSFLLFTIDRLAQGQTKTYEILTGGTVAAVSTTPENLTGKQRSPVPDFGWEVRTITSSSSTTVVNSNSPTMEVDRWKNGRVWFLTGPRAGDSLKVLSNTTTAINTETGIGNPYAVGAKFLVMSSHRDIGANELQLVYAVRLTEHSDYPHGLWYQDRAQSAPKVVGYDSPLSWEPARTFDNNDDVAFKSISPAVGDYFATPNISRTWQGGDDNSNLRERGTADSVVFSSQLPIKRWTLDYQFKNPNGVGKAVIASRTSNAEDWNLHVENVTHYSTLTDISEATHTFNAGPTHLMFGVWPSIGDEIPRSWARDSGGRSGGGYTTMDDDTKDWPTDIWKGARWRVTSGKGQGKSRTVTGNDPNTLTWSTPLESNDVVPNDGSRYEVVNPPLIANVRSNDVWVVVLDTSGISTSSLTSHGAAERVSVRVRANGGASADSAYEVLDVGVDSRYLWVASGNTVVIDCAAQTAYVMNGTTVVRDVSDWVRARKREADGFTGKTPDWFPIQPGSGTFYTARVAGAAQHTVSIALRPGYLG